MKFPNEVQQEWGKKLISQAQDTEFGRLYDFKSIKTYREFKERVPLMDYEDAKPFIERMMMGEQNILWPSEVTWFAKSSGTTSDKSKFIPLSLPMWVEYIRTPDLKIALMGEWEAKLDRIAHQTADEDVTNLAGVPSWMLILLQHIIAMKGVSNILEVWPNLELFMHGGMNFGPYKDQYAKMIPSGQMNYIELYNASEGFFGIQDQKNSDELLLMLDYGIFYEFIPAAQADDENPTVLSLDQVQTNVPYALIITTNSGHWRYKIGHVKKPTPLFKNTLLVQFIWKLILMELTNGLLNLKPCQVI